MAKGEFNESGITIAPVFTEASNLISTAENFQNILNSRLKANPNLFTSTHEIAEALRGLNRIIPYSKILHALYKSYRLESNHEFRAWDLDKRISLMKAIDSDEILKTSTDRWEKLERYNQLHAEIYEFKPDKLEPVIRPPKYFLRNGPEISAEKIGLYEKNKVIEVISSGSHDIQRETILINIYKPKQSKKLIPTFHQGDIAAAALVLHEGRHTFMDQMGRIADKFTSEEFRDTFTILYNNTFGVYYLTGLNDAHMLNPCEKDAYNFQRYMEIFLKASPENRICLIRIVEKQRDRHLSQIKHREMTYPQQALAFAA